MFQGTDLLKLAYFEAVAYGENTFVAVGEGPNSNVPTDMSPRPYIYYSLDGGETWTASNLEWFEDWMLDNSIANVDMNDGAGGNLYNITYAEGKFYAVGKLRHNDAGQYNGFPFIISSEDGIDWEIVFEEEEERESDVASFTSFAYGNGIYVAARKTIISTGQLTALGASKTERLFMGISLIRAHLARL